MRLLAGFIFIVFGCSAFAERLPQIADLMTAEEMKVTGVQRLSEEERQALREWLEVFVEHDAEFAIKAYTESRPEAAEQAGSGESTGERKNRFEKQAARIVGEFSGWSGKTVFKLDNGELWEQRRPDSMRRTKRLVNPEVRIRKNLMGFYVMEVPAAKVKVPVTRIR